jgi:hypothetical protein
MEEDMEGMMIHLWDETVTTSHTHQKPVKCTSSDGRHEFITEPIIYGTVHCEHAGCEGKAMAIYKLDEIVEE